MMYFLYAHKSKVAYEFHWQPKTTPWSVIYRAYGLPQSHTYIEARIDFKITGFPRRLVERKEKCESSIHRTHYGNTVWPSEIF